MNTVAVRDEDAALPVLVQDLADWAQQLDAAMRIAKALCTTSFVPKHYQGKPEEAAAAILAGHELGLGPMAALRIFYNIGGRNELYAEGMVAILTSHGHRVWTVERTNESVTVAGRRQGEEHVEQITITMDDAKRAGWTRNETYQKTPADMLYARAASRVCRRVAPDLLHGIPAVGELEEPPLQVTATVGDPVPPTMTGADIIASAATGEHVKLAVDTPEPERVTPMITEPMMRKLHAALRDKGLGDRELGLVHISGILGREITTTKDLTRAEAGRVIDAVEALPMPGAEQQELEP